VKECGLDDNTYIVYTADNGPWLVKKENGGSAGPLRSGKGSSWEGGVRVPCIMRAPGRIPADRVSHELISTLDILPTFAHLAGGEVPKDRIIDGKDQSSLIGGKTDKSARETYFYYVKNSLQAVRQGKWKLALPDRKAFYDYAKDDVPVTAPELYDLDSDLSEKKNVAKDHPDIVANLLKLADQVREDLGDVDKIGRNTRARSE
jgi:arylsulfatase